MYSGKRISIHKGKEVKGIFQKCEIMTEIAIGDLSSDTVIANITYYHILHLWKCHLKYGFLVARNQTVLYCNCL